MDRPGFEPGTSRVRTERSSRLSYRPSPVMVGYGVVVGLYSFVLGYPEPWSITCIAYYGAACIIA